jgi:CubicO group peptidase (beta-lactamase class C family)
VASVGAASGEVLASDQERSTELGDVFTAPAHFTYSRRGSVTTLRAPEGDLTLTVVEVEAADADGAIAAAWGKKGGVAVRPVLTSRTLPAQRGFDLGLEVEHATNPNERLTVVSSARGRDRRWIVLLTDGANATVQKRGAAITLVDKSVRAKGYARETFAGRKAHALDAARVAEITAFVEEAQKMADVPGIGFGLIQGGKVVFAGGFGVRERGKPEKVDQSTLFAIASNTKALTTLLLALLVDEGKLAWDMPVTKAFPGFALADREATERMLLRHLVCACTGLPRQDWKPFFEFGRAAPKDVFVDLAKAKPTTGFGEAYQYSNFLATAAGYVAGHAAFPGRELGEAYDAALRGRVLDPLGMSATSFDVAHVLRTNHASPHGQDFRGDTAVGPLELLSMIVPWRPTGGAWSSVRDMLGYLELELAGGMLPNGKRLVSEANLLERRRKQIAMDADTHYGMGLRVRNDWGTPVVFHGGIRSGFASQMFFLPEHGVAGVILTNADSGWFVRDPIIRRIAEVLFDGRAEAAAALAGGAAENRAWIRKERADFVLPADGAAVAALAARYRNEELGDIAVRRGASGVVFDFGEWSSSMASRKNADGTVTFVTADPGEVGFEFHVASRDGRRTLVTREMQYEYELIEAP